VGDQRERALDAVGLLDAVAEVVQPDDHPVVAPVDAEQERRRRAALDRQRLEEQGVLVQARPQRLGLRDAILLALEHVLDLLGQRRRGGLALEDHVRHRAPERVPRSKRWRPARPASGRRDHPKLKQARCLAAA